MKPGISVVSGLLGAVLLAVVGVSYEHAGPPERKSLDGPNVLIIVSDDQRGGMGVMPTTRRLFKRRGRTYPNAFATTPLCCPSRMSIMTGLYAHNHGIKDNNPDESELIRGDTLQSRLGTAGYRTAIYGKYLNQWPVEQNPPHFDDFTILKTGSYSDAWGNDNGDVGIIPGYNTDVLGDRASGFIESMRASERPWLMFVTPYAPHGPFTPEPAYAKAKVGRWKGNPAVRRRDRSTKPRYVRRAAHTLADGREVRRKQLRTLMSVDDLVGRIFSVLRRTGQADDTLAFYLSDNGFLWGEHGLRGKGPPYDQTTKVRMFARWPGRIGGGSEDRRLVGNVDLAPTVLAAAGSPLGGLDGRDLLDSGWRRGRIHLEYWCNMAACRPWAATRTPRAQYTEYYGRRGGVRFREFYRIKRDPWQLVNLLRDGRRRNDPDVPALRRRLARDRVCAGSRGPAACP